MRGKKVLVVGAGNTGCDIAVEAAQAAAKCWHSSRRGYWYAPKYALGRPADQVNDRILALRLPLRLRQWLLEKTIRLTVGDLSRFGLAKPDHRIYETHPIVNSQLVYYIGHGRVLPVPDIKRFDHYEVELTDGRTIEPDLVIFATGYLPRFEFLGPELLSVDSSGRPRLALQMLSRVHPTLAVAGLIQPDSAIFTIVHWQTVLLARWLRLLDAGPDRAADLWSQVPGVAGSPVHRGQRQGLDPALVRDQPLRVPTGAREDPERAGGGGMSRGAKRSANLPVLEGRVA